MDGEIGMALQPLIDEGSAPSPMIGRRAIPITPSMATASQVALFNPVPIIVGLVRYSFIWTILPYI